MNPKVEGTKLVPIEEFARLASDEQINRSALAQEAHGITKPDPPASKAPAANQPFIKPVTLIGLGGNTGGGYCDPLTGECYPTSEMDDPVFQKEKPMTTAIDPVCKMEVEIETAQYKSEHAGEMYYFCSAGCQKSFVKDPHQYLPEDHHGQDHSHEGH